MKQKLININNYQYLCEYYENGVDFDNSYGNKEFVILRNFDIFNEVAYDTDIFFIEKSLYEEIKSSPNTDKICFPVHINKIINYSNEFEKFNNYHLLNIDNFCYDIKSDLVGEGQKTLLKCDKVRIYNPTIKTNIDFIIHIDNIISGINFHYICNINANYEKKVEIEKNINKYKYIEFIEIYFPNIKSLFNTENKYYILDDINNIININDEDIENVSDYYYYENEIDHSKNVNKLYFYQLVNSYFLKRGEDGTYSKVYINNDRFNYNENFINTTVNVTLFPYDNVLNGIYVNNSENMQVETFIENNYYFRLQSYFGFDNGIISVINKFLFPGKVDTDDENYDYVVHGDVYEKPYYNKIDYQVTDYYNSFFIEENVGDYYEHDGYLDEIDIEGIRTTGYYIQFATDVYFKNIVYESKINTDNNDYNFIYDFSFSLNKIVDSWYQLNSLLAIRCTFIDKRLNIFIKGNIVVLNKEWFKYLINDSGEYQVSFLKQNNLIINDFMNVNEGFNFINNINCSIVDKVIETNDNSISNKILNSSNNTTIIYKPIFYKVNDLQNIKLREGVIQNIGINLEQYFTKVDTFILNIEGYNVKEFSRNGSYVIFKVNSSNIENTTGSYNILDQNFEYISSGNYMMF